MPKKEEIKKFEEIVGKIEPLKEQKTVKIIWDGKQFRIPLPIKIAESAGVQDGSEFEFVLEITKDKKELRGKLVG